MKKLTLLILMILIGLLAYTQTDTTITIRQPSLAYYTIYAISGDGSDAKIIRKSTYQKPDTNKVIKKEFLKCYTIEDFQKYVKYETECYNDSTYISTGDVIFNGTTYISMGGKFIHKQPTFEGFIDWIRLKR